MEPEECVICLEEYSNAHIPQTLPCAHMICDKCMDSITSSDLECPICRNPCTKTEIVPNFDLISKILKDHITNLSSLQQQFETRLEQVVQTEIDKQLECISKLDKCEKDFLRLISGIRQKLNDIMNYNTGIKVQTLMKIEEDIEILSFHLKENLANFEYENVSSFVDSIEAKYKKQDIRVTLKLFNCESWKQTLEKLLKTVQEASELSVSEQSLCLFGENSAKLIHRTREPRSENRFASKLLFNPQNQNLDIMNMEKKERFSFSNNLIDRESHCFQLHPNTVCVVTHENVIYIDTTDHSTYLVHCKFYWEGFCLGRFRGDLVIMGGSRRNSAVNGQEVLIRQKRKEWKNLDVLKRTRNYATAESINNKIYVFGGNPDLSIEYFSNDHWQVLSTRLISAYSHIVSCMDSDSVYLLGGVSNSSEINTTIYKFDSSNCGLQPLETINYQVLKASNCSACCVDGQLYYNIGENIYQYDLDR